MSMILNLSVPRGAETSTVSTFLRPMIALPTGDSFDSLFSAGFASAEPTMWYSTVLFAFTSRRRTFVPTETSPDLISFFVTTRALLRRSSSMEMRASRWACSFFAESYSAFSAMSPNSRASRMRSAISRRLSVERYSISSWSFLYPSGVRMTSFKTTVLLETPARNGRWADARPAGADGTSGPGWSSTAPGYDVRLMPANLLDSWRIGEIEIPTRVVLAPMAGVSVQAFRRQGRRYGAGLVCSEMVSCAGIEHRNERTLGYLRVAADEHPLAIQIFGSEPGAMAEAARMVIAAGADIVDMNFGCPVRKVTKTGAGACLLEDPGRACRIVGAVAGAVDVPVSVKMRRGLENGSRVCLDVGPRLVEAGAASLTLHPRSAKQMYTGEADHSLTAELVERVDVPVVASGDITSRARARAVLATTGASAVMVGRAAQGNPWVLQEIMEDDPAEPSREEVVAELLLFMRETVRELGEQRATSFLKKFYGWYLGGGRFPRPFKSELTQLPTIADVEQRLLIAAPGAADLLERLEGELPADEVELELPISIY